MELSLAQLRKRFPRLRLSLGVRLLDQLLDEEPRLRDWLLRVSLAEAPRLRISLAEAPVLFPTKASQETARLRP